MAAKENIRSLRSLIELVHHRWNIPIIAALYRQSGAKFVTLANTLSVSRGALSASLNDLIDHGLVMRNPGHGHPMRPEYLLTEAGMAIGEECLSLQQLIGRRDEQDLAYRKWTLPLVMAIGNDVRRFNEVQLLLPDASPRAITIGLKSLLCQRWAKRMLIDDFPPTAGYELLPKGRSVFNHVSPLC
jgi:DNA-binding HxlR family transcriptional regulator